MDEAEQTKICQGCGEAFNRPVGFSDANWNAKLYCRRACKKTYNVQTRYQQAGNRFWWALAHGPIAPELQPAYEAAKAAARKWNLKRLPMSAA